MGKESAESNLFNVNNTGVLSQSPEPEARNKVLNNNPDQIGIWKCWLGCMAQLLCVLDPFIQTIFFKSYFCTTCIV